MPNHLDLQISNKPTNAGLGYFYGVYADEVKQEIKTIKKRIDNLTKTRSYLLKKLEVYTPYIVNKGDVNFKHLRNIKQCKVVLPKFISLMDEVGKSKTSAQQVIEFLLGRLVETNDLLFTLKNRLYKIENKKQPYPIFADVLKMFNAEIGEQLKVNGYHLTIGGGLGSIQIVSVFGNDGINWAESLKLKQQIIDEGKVPYQAYRDENGNITGDNGGLKWFVGYGNDYSYIWRWKRQRDLKNLKEIIYYRFSPTQDQYRSLYHIINANSLQHHKYPCVRDGNTKNNVR
jgi:nucleoside-triphosphatase THEP1